MSHPGREYVEPKVIQAWKSPAPRAPAPAPATDFANWTESELRTFIDSRGGDLDDCIDFYALVERAAECEANTGPAQRPSGADAPHAPQAEPEGAEIDPLEAFMADIDDTIAQQRAVSDSAGAGAGAGAEPAPPNPSAPKPTASTFQCDDDDATEEYIAQHAAARHRTAAHSTAPRAPSAAGYGSDEDVYATAQAIEDANAAPERTRSAAPLPPVDHSSISYPPFKRGFYDEPPDVFAMDDEEVDEARESMCIQVEGRDVVKPVSEFEQCGFPKELSAVIGAAGFAAPTPIQAQVLPVALSGRDVLGIAQTGSGKTAAFMLPLVVHVAAAPRTAPRAGPVALVLAPTRELAEQIHKEARRFAKPFHLRVCAAWGGLQRHSQVLELRKGVEVAVATPGRAIDLVQLGACPLTSVTLLVLDEVDRCFDLGLEPQVRSIAANIRPDRQTLAFSATMPARVRDFVASSLHDAVDVTVGAAGKVNRDVKQQVLVLGNTEAKMEWLRARLPSFVDQGEVLVFANTHSSVEALAAVMEAWSIKATAIHGDMDQFTRMAALNKFKRGDVHVLVATDVASRGLDIRSIKTVLCFDAARSLDTHVHRVGRTGRAGDRDGAAWTLVLPSETRIARALVGMLREIGQEVPQNLASLAHKAQRGKGRGRSAIGGAGLGFNQTGPPAPFTTAASPAGPPPAAAHPPGPAAAFSSSPVQHHNLPPPPAPAATPAATTQSPSRFTRTATQTSTGAGGGTPAGLPGLPVAASQAADRLTRGVKRPWDSEAAAAGPGAAPSVAPKGFVLSRDRVGGYEERPTIVMPKAPQHEQTQADDSSTSWLDKRIRAKQQGLNRFRAAAAAAPARPLSPGAVARAVATAQQAAARLMASGATGQTYTSASTASPAPHGGAGQPNSDGNAGLPGASTRPPSVMSAEEARKIAQEAAARILKQTAERPRDA